ncbi:hypothetical protein BU26DRAFT_349380 [Trematosphaeria pertusa]|uniref:Uncharacterized protein n=1 Tax=Trematosphaeria pertusa TaxID=390896 RepID=A0A6A6IAV7_9PLEO|nr:uncharacterized protein BU26DRAFT_349380 [Trematosphaeria pertusa]KAF2247546.1 hypothetical protein BU26DRAFT_349380 [Trematosphaeria pertusa]
MSNSPGPGPLAVWDPSDSSFPRAGFGSMSSEAEAEIDRSRGKAGRAYIIARLLFLIEWLLRCCASHIICFALVFEVLDPIIGANALAVRPQSRMGSGRAGFDRMTSSLLRRTHCTFRCGFWILRLHRHKADVGGEGTW